MEAGEAGEEMNRDEERSQLHDTVQ
jgi:hypothetical protein